MRRIVLDLDDTLDFGVLTVDVAIGMTMIGDELVRIINVMGARKYTVPVLIPVTQEEALKLAAAIIEWDCAMMEAADDPFRGAGPKASARQVIRSFLPRILPCELRDLYVETCGYAGALR